MMEQIFPGLTSAPNLHPMVVHFPIAFWLAATGAWFIALARKNEYAWRFGLWLHSLGLLGAALAVGFGFWATSTMGHDSPGHDLVHVHRDIMLWATGVATVVTVVGWWKQTPKLRLPLAILSLLVVGLLTMGADRGAELVFRYGMGVAHQEPPTTGHSHNHGDEHSNHHPEPGGRQGAAVSAEEVVSPVPSSESDTSGTERAAPKAQPDKPASHDHGGHEH